MYFMGHLIFTTYICYFNWIGVANNLNWFEDSTSHITVIATKSQPPQTRTAQRLVAPSSSFCALISSLSCGGKRRALASRSFGFGPLEPLLVTTPSSFFPSISFHALNLLSTHMIKLYSYGSFNYECDDQ